MSDMTIEQKIAAAANGDPNAERFLAVFAHRAHLIDDIVDRDKVVNGIQIVNAEATWLCQMAANPFWLKHSVTLTPIMLLALNSWADSWDLPPPQCDVLKGQWHEVIYAVALLTGGWGKLRELTPAAREYDINVPVVVVGAKELR
jgi:hypothetical protein